MPDPVSDDPQPPDWAIRVVSNPRARQPVGDIEAAKQPTGTQPLDAQRLEQFTSWSQNVAGKDELASGDIPVSGSAVNGSVQTNAVGIAPASAVAVKQTNMLVSQSFTSPNTVIATGQWSWSGDDGHLFNGCARLDCTGNQDDLVSNEVLVIKDETVQVTVWVKWADLEYTGTDPIVLGIQKYRKGRDPDSGGTVYMDIGGVNIDSVTSPASSGGWVELTGTYTVPARVDQLRFKFSAATATAGYVLWDEAVFEKLDLIQDAAVPGVGKTVDNVVTKLQGSSGSNFTHDDEATALAGAANALTSNASSVSQLQSQQGSGVIAGDDFSYTGELIASTKWGGTQPAGAPTYQADGADAVWSIAGGGRSWYPINTEHRSYYDWRGTSDVSSTDYQKVEVVLSSGMGNYSAASARLLLYGRISADWQYYVELELVAYGTYNLRCNVGGSKTVLTTGSWTNTLAAGTTVTLYCGDKLTTTPLAFKAQINGTNIFTYTDTGTSVYGATRRKWGWGGSGMITPYPFVGDVVYAPPKINQWIGNDQ